MDILPRTMSDFAIVGLGDTAVQEAKHRLRSAIRSAGAEYPRNKKTVNLAPADLKKSGPVYDLPIALGLLAASGQIKKECFEGAMVIGELALDGRVRHVNGIVAITAFAKQSGFSRIILPVENSAEAALISGLGLAFNVVANLWAIPRWQAA